MLCLFPGCRQSHSANESDGVPRQVRRGVQWGKQEKAVHSHCTGRQSTYYFPGKASLYFTCSFLIAKRQIDG